MSTLQSVLNWPTTRLTLLKSDFPQLYRRNTVRWKFVMCEESTCINGVFWVISVKLDLSHTIASIYTDCKMY